LKTTLLKLHILFLLIVFLSGNISVAQEASITFTHLLHITDRIESPVRLAIDKDDIIYVSDAFKKSIAKFNNSGEFMGMINPSRLSLIIEPELNVVMIGRPQAIAS